MSTWQDILKPNSYHIPHLLQRIALEAFQLTRRGIILLYIYILWYLYPWLKVESVREIILPRAKVRPHYPIEKPSDRSGCPTCHREPLRWSCVLTYISKRYQLQNRDHLRCHQTGEVQDKGWILFITFYRITYPGNSQGQSQHTEDYSKHTYSHKQPFRSDAFILFSGGDVKQISPCWDGCIAYVN